MVSFFRVFRSALFLAIIVALVPAIASAHARRQVGSYTFVVGWLNEPTLQGEPNGLDLTITDSSGKPVSGAEKTLKVGIAYGGGVPKDEPLTARFGLPGKYTFQVIPTKAGAYSFIFSGTLNGQPINERFDSGPNTFDDVTAPTVYQFPEPLPATADIAQQAQTANGTAQAALQRATLFGFAGIGVGLVGLVVAIVALVARARPVEVAREEPGAPVGEGRVR